MDMSTLKLLEFTTALIVEDDEIVLFGLREALRPYCKNVYTASNGEEGLEEYKKHIVDVVITDINMPELNGFEMVREILKIKPTQDFIVITSYDSDKNVLTSIEEGAYSFLRKPIRIEDLQTQLLILASKKTQQATQLSDNFLVDPNKETIIKNGTQIYLSATLNPIFWLLFNDLNKVVRYEAIACHGFQNADINKNAIRIAISRLSEIIGKEHIENVSGIGYRLKSI